MLRYEGMTNSMNIYKFASWKKNCTAHERWEHVIEAEELSATMSVDMVMKELKKLLKVKGVEINMRNNKFVDKIVSDNPEKEYNVMVPESQLDSYINHNAELKKLGYRTLFRKSFYENIDADFPYVNMTLQQIGIPSYDIIQVSTDKGQFFVELTGDKGMYV